VLDGMPRGGLRFLYPLSNPEETWKTIDE